MTENLLQKLEEKMMQLLTELEDARRELRRLNDETSFLKMERDAYTEKLSGLVGLLGDTIGAADNNRMAMPTMKPVLVQEMR